jgi:2,4-dienoyl-CoA reductase-like NADH-dependent reductase (Old Yellow Enzyme family)
VPYVERVRKNAQMLTVAIGLIVEARQAEAILADGRADMVAIGTEMRLNPFWPAHAARTLDADPEFKRMPVQYGWWLDRRRKTGYAG